MERWDGRWSEIRLYYFSKNIFLWDLGIVTLPLLLIHLTRRFQLRHKRQREELEKMNIQEL